MESTLADTGISLEILELCITKGLSHKRDYKIFKQLLLCDNFLAFKSIMIAKNKELEVQALQEIGGPASTALDEK